MACLFAYIILDPDSIHHMCGTAELSTKQILEEQTGSQDFRVTLFGDLFAGQMAVQGNVGGGSFICGLRRVLSEHHTLEFQGALGECLS